MRSAERSTGRRLGSGVATVAIHALLLMVLLRTGVAPPIAIDQRPLAVFDIAPPPPPPPPPPEIPRPPKPERTQPQPADHPAAAGGAKPVATIERATIDQSAPLAMNVTVVPDTPLVALAASSTPGTATADGAAGAGGNGRDSGGGEGNGDRLEGGAAQRFQRADWIKRPTEAEINRFWPAEAIKRKIGGKVYLACAMSRPGKPDRCISIFEEPTGVGFGAAAVRLSALFRIRPIRINDRDASDLPVIVPVTFNAKK